MKRIDTILSAGTLALILVTVALMAATGTIDERADGKEDPK